MIYVTSDLHGHMDCLEKLLVHVDFCDGDWLYIIGDIIDRNQNGSAYPSTELMLPLAKELGVTIEDLYKVISEDKSPNTKIRTILEYMMQRSKTITIICSVLALVPYVLFVCFSDLDNKLTLAISTPIIVAVVYVMLYLMFVLFRKKSFCFCQGT